jgi:ABC-type transport system involved in multi-copper enzyme maturation permease subunit
MLRLLASIGGPIFAKELIESARRKRYFVNRVLYAAALLIVLALVWENAYYLRQGPITTREMARFARDMFVAVSVVQYSAVWFFVPVFVCGLIAAEREAQSLDLLLTTHLLDREIVLGKLASRLAITAVILLSTLPVVALVGMFGGIDVRSVWQTLLSTLLAMLFAGAFSIYFSSVSRSPIGSLVRTYWWLAVWLIGLPFATLLVIELLTVGPPGPIGVILFGQIFINPIGSFIAAIGPGFERVITTYVGRWYFWPMYVFPTIISLLLIWRAVARLRVDPSRLAIARMAKWLANKFAPTAVAAHQKRSLRRAARAERWFWLSSISNPIWLRSRLARVYDREGYIGRIQWAGWLLAAGFFLLIALNKPRDLSDNDAAAAFLIPAWIGLGLLIVVISASSFVSDRRRGFFDLVLVTTLEPREIVDGTLLAVWQHVRRTWWLAAVLTGLLVMTGAVVPHLGFVSLVTGTLFGATIALAGVMTSLAARSLPQSLVPTFVLPVLMTLGTGLMIGYFREAAGPIAWFLAPFLLLATTVCTRHSISSAAIGAHFIAVHLALVLAATAFSFDATSLSLPLGLCNPASMVIGAAVERTSIGSLLSNRRYPHSFDATWYVAAYWLAMIVNILWARRWMVKRFDQLTGRVRPLAADR